MRGYVMDIDCFAQHDGPGIRSCVFLQGCPLSCEWCQSPESQSPVPQVLYAAGRCAGCGACVKACPRGLHTLNGGHAFNRERNKAPCRVCGLCAKVCPTGALSLSSREMESDELIKTLLIDKIFFDASGGGVTLSGGEVLFQAAFAAEVLKGLKANGVHTVVETSGYGKTSDLLMLSDYASLFYFDFKLYGRDSFKAYTGGDPGLVFKNLAALCEKSRAVELRVPVVPGITGTEENITKAYETALSHGIRKVWLLPYNPSAPVKYEWIGKEYTLRVAAEDGRFYERLLDMAPAGVCAEIQDNGKRRQSCPAPEKK